MKITSITSESNNTLKLLRSLHRRQTREKEKLFLLEGTHCLTEAFNKKIELVSVVASQTYLRDGMEEIGQLDISEISVVDDKLFEGLVSTSSSCGVIAMARMRLQNRDSFASIKPRVFAVADAIQDPGNLGTLIRTACAAETGALLMIKGSVDQYNPKVVRAAVGALFDLPIFADLEPEEALSMLGGIGASIVVCEAQAKTRYFEADLADSVAMVFGNEGQGVNPVLRSAAAQSISIPMNPRSESLNVAVSGGIILFESLKQRLMLATR